jgi:hypothetical protein
MDPDPLDPNQLQDNPPDLQAARTKMGKEWAMVFIAVIVMIVIVALVAWHLTQGK